MRPLHDMTDEDLNEVQDHGPSVKKVQMMIGDGANRVAIDHARNLLNDHGHDDRDDFEMKDHGHVKDHPILDLDQEIRNAQQLLDQEHQTRLKRTNVELWRT